MIEHKMKNICNENNLSREVVDWLTLDNFRIHLDKMLCYFV